MALPSLARLSIERAAPTAAPSRAPDVKYASDLLGKDELELILDAIGASDESKKGACNDALAWCKATPDHHKMCNPSVWRKLAKRMFEFTADDDLFGKGLIYSTFVDDEDPRAAFERMCSAQDMASVLAKRFATFAFDKYSGMLWEQWADRRAEMTGLGEAVEDLSEEEDNKMAMQYFPDLAHTRRWEADAKAQFDRAPSKTLYYELYNGNADFSKRVDLFFNSAVKYLFDEQHIWGMVRTDLPEKVRGHHAICEIGEVLGVYIVCLSKLARYRKAFLAKHKARFDSLSDEERLALDKHLEDMDQSRLNHRLRVVHAIERILLPATPETAEDDDTTDVYRQMAEYDTDVEFDHGKDKQKKPGHAGRRRRVRVF